MKLSVIVPSYQSSRFIGETLDSILSQNQKEIEIRVCDAASTDGTVEILESYGNKIEYVSQRDLGRADAINQGLREASGDIFAYLNCGDVYFPGAIKRVFKHFTDNPHSLCVYGQAWTFRGDGSKMERFESEPWSYPRLLENCYLCQPAVFWRREVMEKVGFFVESLQWTMDYDYWLRAGRCIPFDYLDNSFLAGSRSQVKARAPGERVKADEESLELVMRHSSRPPSLRLLKLAQAIVEEKQSWYLPLKFPEEAKRAMVVEAALERADFHGIPADEEFLNTLEILI